MVKSTVLPIIRFTYRLQLVINTTNIACKTEFGFKIAFNAERFLLKFIRYFDLE